MSASISYRSSSSVPDDISSQIDEYVSELSQGYDWWAEPIVFFDNPEFPGHLWGDTKLFCLLETDEGVAHDSFMAYTDACKIASILEEASREFGIDWVLLFEGEEIGRIVQGKQTSEFEEQSEMLLEVCTMLEVDPDSLNREELIQMYQDR